MFHKRRILELLADDIKQYQANIDELFCKYRNTIDQFKQQYNDATFATAKAAASKTFREIIVKEQEKLQEAYKAAADCLRTDLSNYVTKPIDRDLLANLQVVKDFNVRMSKYELDAFIKKAADNIMALRVLDSVARGSGYKLNYTTIEVLHQDITMLERQSNTPYLYAPQGYLAEAREVYPDFEHVNEYGVRINEGRPSESQFYFHKTFSDALVNKKISEIIERWTHTVLPTFEECKTAAIRKRAEEMAGNVSASREMINSHESLVEKVNSDAGEIYNAEKANAAESVEVETLPAIANTSESTARRNAIISKYM